ncbi:MAG: hypothetical protein ACO2PM_10285 [Pyrobaculum sp.]
MGVVGEIRRRGGYEYVRAGVGVNQYDVFCSVVVNGVRLDQPHCRAVGECVEEMQRDYRRELERLREPPEPASVIKTDPVEELLKEWPELSAFGVEWVRKWLDLRDRLIEIAKVMHKYP